MQSYTKIVKPIEALTVKLFPGTMLAVGSVLQLNEQAIKARQVFIGLDENFILTRATPDASSEQTTILLDVGIVARNNPTSKELSNAKQTADILSDTILTELPEIYEAFDVEMKQIRRVPYTNKSSGTLCGFLMEINLNVGGCDIADFGDLTKYTANITDQINPFDLH